MVKGDAPSLYVLDYQPGVLLLQLIAGYVCHFD